MENNGYYSRQGIEARYGKLPDEQWKFIEDYFADEDSMWLEGEEPSLEDEIAYLISNYEFLISPFTADYANSVLAEHDNSK